MEGWSFDIQCPEDPKLNKLTAREVWVISDDSALRVSDFWSDLMFIGPCIIVIVEEYKTNFMSLPTLFHFLCAQHVSDINISIIRSLRLFC